MNDIIKKLQDVLVGKEFEQEDYYDGLKNIVKEFGLEANTCDFDTEHIYNAGYEEKEDWDSELVAIVSIEFIPVFDEDGNTDHHAIKIIDVY